MYQILLVDDSPLDREVTKDILTSGLEKVTVRAMDRHAMDAHMGENDDVDLFILDVLPDAAGMWRQIAAVRKHSRNASILLTSSGQEEKLPHLVLQSGASGYLLKPFRPNHLLAAVQPLVRAEDGAQLHRGQQLRDRHLSRMEQAVKECAYKRCIEVAKEYVDQLWLAADLGVDVRSETVYFAEGVAELGRNFGPGLRWKLTGYLERFRSRYDLQGRKYETCILLEEMLDAIFDEMDQNACYFDDALKKVMNYIERNIKKGINLDEAAEHVNMSSCYFSKFFKKEMGVNFITYVTDRKIESAKEMLLNTDMPVISIACELSYNETNYFSKAFKKKVGLTPTEFRERGTREQEPKPGAAVVG